MHKTSNQAIKFFDKSELLHITQESYRNSVKALFEWLINNDQVQHDITTRLLFSKKATEPVTAQIISRENVVVAGVEEITYFIKTFTHLDITVLAKDGESIKAGEQIIQLSGKPEEILIYERTILNIMQRLCGIATETNKIVTAIRSRNLAKEPFISATRKIVWSLLDKKAVSVGGGLTHRLSLGDGILVKDNHLLILERIYNLHNETDAVVKTLELVLQKAEKTLIEIEVEKKESITALLKVFLNANTDNVLGVLLDNFTPDIAKQTINELQSNDLSNIVFEASGGINSDNISSWADTGVDIISLGSLTHSIKAADISLEIIFKKAFSF